jgi:hypothetical protein
MKKYKFEVINLTSKKRETVEITREYSVYDRKTNSYTVITCELSNYDSPNESPQTK